MRSRITLRQLKQQAANTLSKANTTLNQGQLSLQEIRTLVALAVGLVETTSDFVEDLADGIEFEIQIPQTGNSWIDMILDKWGGKIPLTLRMDPREKDQK